MSTAANFLELVRQSQLISPEELNAAFAAFEAASAKVKEGADATAADLARHLIRSNLITMWQAEKLLSGKNKGFFLGKYKLLEPLGAGGMSFVYLAENQLLGQRRAIKVLPKSKVTDSSYLERFYREARAAAQLNHPNIVRTFDIDQQGDQHYMVMEFIDGEDLSSLVKRVGPLPINDAVNYLRQSAAALQHAHQAGLIHRDVKPGNLLLNKQGQIKLLDLGLAKFTDQLSNLTVIHNETLMGTADFLSPEQALHSHLVDLRADIYSLGGTFYFFVAGHPPFPDGTVAQRLVRHQSVEPPTLASLRPDCPTFLSQLCEWMMRKKAEDRCRDCGEILDYLEKWQRDPNIALPLLQARPPEMAKSIDVASAANSTVGVAPVAAKPNKPAKPAKPPTRRPSNSGGYWLLIALIIVLVGAVAGLFFAFRTIQ
ncbi:MAG: protein kinase [Pirellulaceae bacterium]|nr:protein kinase [Pirellulaceae bacterium]